MNTQLTTTTFIVVNAPAAKVWDALTNPVKIKQYLYNTVVETDWQVGSPIRFSGEWQGKPFEDKGAVLAFEPEKQLQYSYWSAFTGVPDLPENYSTVAFDLAPQEGATKLTVTQANFKDEAHRDHTKNNWESVLRDIKKLAEQ